MCSICRPAADYRSLVRLDLRLHGQPRADVLRRTRAGWEVWSEGSPGRRLGGPYASEAQARRRLQQVEYFKSTRDDEASAQGRAQLVALARAKRLADGLKRRRSGPRRRPRIPRPLPPDSIVADYSRELVAIVKRARAAYAPLIEALPMLVKQAAEHRERTDAPGDDHATRARNLADRAAAEFRRQVQPADVERMARRIADRSQTWGAEQLRRQIRAALGVDPVFRDPGMKAAVSAFAHENAALIVRIPERLHGDVQAIVLGGLNRGAHVDELEEELEDRFDISARHARLIARDQVGKLVGKINRQRQRNLGINSYVWRTTGDDRVRDSHDELDGETFDWDEPPTNDDAEEIEPGSDYQCFPGNTPVSAHAPVVAAFRRWYRGEGTVLLTEDGRRLASTPNHPILTAAGWKPAQFVDVGDYLVKAQPQRGEGPVLDEHHGDDPAIEEVFRSLAPFGRATTTRGRGFHGDAPVDQEINVVRVDRGLVLELDPRVSQCLCEHVLACADESRLRPSPLGLLFGRVHPSAARLVRGGGKLLALVAGGGGQPDPHGGRAIARLDALLDEVSAHGRSLDAEVLRDLLHAPALGVEPTHHLARVVAGIVSRALVNAPRLHAPSAEELAQAISIRDPERERRLGDRHRAQEFSRVVEKRGCDLATHVYNLETETSWYLARGLVAHNCRCWSEPVLDDILDDVDDDSEGDDEED